MRKAYKYKLRLNAKFTAECERTLESCRFGYNSALSQRISYYRQGSSIGFLEQARQLTEARELPEARAVLRSFQTNTLKQLDRAYQAFFRRLKGGNGKPGLPRFKGYERFDSFSTLNARAFRIEGDRLTVHKLGSCRVRLSRPLEGIPKTLTMRREADGWYVVIVCDVDARPLP